MAYATAHPPERNYGRSEYQPPPPINYTCVDATRTHSPRVQLSTQPSRRRYGDEFIAGDAVVDTDGRLYKVRTVFWNSRTSARVELTPWGWSH